MQPRGTGTKCDDNCILKACNSCALLKGWKLDHNRLHGTGSRTILGHNYWEEVVSRVYYCSCSRTLTTNEDYCNSLPSHIRVKLPCMLTKKSGLSVELLDEVHYFLYLGGNCQSFCNQVNFRFQIEYWRRASVSEASKPEEKFPNISPPSNRKLFQQVHEHASNSNMVYMAYRRYMLIKDLTTRKPRESLPSFIISLDLTFKIAEKGKLLAGGRFINPCDVLLTVMCEGKCILQQLGCGQSLAQFQCVFI